MMRPRYEDPINTAKDMVKNNITLFNHQYYAASQQSRLLYLDIPEWNYIANNMYFAEDWNEVLDLIEHGIHGTGKYAYAREGFKKL